MSAPPWMPLYIADYLADTGHLSAAQSGAYLHLIMHYWQRGGLPSDEGALSRIARMTTDEWGEARAVLAGLFIDGWRHKRIDAELKKAAETMARRSASGKHAASVRYANRMRSAVQTHAPSEGEGEGSNLDASPPEQKEASPREGTTSAPMARLEFASAFWPEFPHKVGRRAAEEAFVKARRRATLPEIMDGLARYKSDKPPDRQWLNPATFLNQERWNDEPAPASSRTPGDKPHDTIFRALATVVEKRSGNGRGPPLPDDGLHENARADADHRDADRTIEGTVNPVAH